jgi:hypothetical protein
MQPKIKVGLVVGIIGLALNVCVAGAFGICGPFVSLIGGAVAGFFAGQQEKPASKSEGAKTGAIAGVITGALILVGQVLGTLGALAIVQYSGIKLAFGAAPSTSADLWQQVLYYVTGAGTGTCFGIIGIVLAALAGAGVSYLSTSETK